MLCGWGWEGGEGGSMRSSRESAGVRVPEWDADGLWLRPLTKGGLAAEMNAPPLLPDLGCWEPWSSAHSTQGPSSPSRGSLWTHCPLSILLSRRLVLALPFVWPFVGRLFALLFGAVLGPAIDVEAKAEIEPARAGSSSNSSFSFASLFARASASVSGEGMVSGETRVGVGRGALD